MGIVFGICISWTFFGIKDQTEIGCWKVLNLDVLSAPRFFSTHHPRLLVVSCSKHQEKWAVIYQYCAWNWFKQLAVSTSSLQLGFSSQICSKQYQTIVESRSSPTYMHIYCTCLIPKLLFFNNKKVPIFPVRVPLHTHLGTRQLIDLHGKAWHGS